MICEASGGILPNLVIYHHERFYVSPFIVVGYPLHLLDPKILWGNKPWWIALIALELFSATSFCSVNLIHVQTSNHMARRMTQEQP